MNLVSDTVKTMSWKSVAINNTSVNALIHCRNFRWVIPIVEFFYSRPQAYNVRLGQASVNTAKSLFENLMSHNANFPSFFGKTSLFLVPFDLALGRGNPYFLPSRETDILAVKFCFVSAVLSACLLLVTQTIYSFTRRVRSYSPQF